MVTFVSVGVGLGGVLSAESAMVVGLVVFL